MQLAMPLFSDTTPIDFARVQKLWAEEFPGSPKLVFTDGKDGAQLCKVGDCQLAVLHMPLAIPNGEAVEAVRTSWMWQVDDAPLREHRAHAVVTAFASGDAVEDAWNVTRLSAVLLRAGKGTALYWGNSRQVHQAELVLEAVGEESPPVMLWVGLTMSARVKGGPISVATHGLERLGHKEFEVLDTRMRVGELRRTLLNIAAYVLDQGPVLLDGQTFGPDAATKWSVRHTASVLVPGRDVILLGIP